MLIMTEIEKKFVVPKRFANGGESTWDQHDLLVSEYESFDLGKNIPDFAAVKILTEALVKTAESENILLHQYTNGYGHPRLVTVLSKIYGKLLSREINPKTEILGTIGTHEALFTAIDGHVDNGDRVVLIEPSLDVYRAMVKNAGGIIDSVPLELSKTASSTTSSSDYVLNSEKLKQAFNEKTKAIILNNPNSPMGKVYSKADLELIADLCKKWNVICISDESHEWEVYKPQRHLRIASLPGMWERTITVGSADAAFNASGWKAAWVLCPENLILNLQMVHQTCGYVSPTPIQEAVAIGFEKEFARWNLDNCLFTTLPISLQTKRDFMFKVLTDVGMKPILPEGGHFMIADCTDLVKFADLEKDNTESKDLKLVKWIARNIGVQGIPLSSFYGDLNQTQNQICVVFCFTKSMDGLQKAAELFRKWKNNTH